MAMWEIPVVDLSPFLRPGDEDGKREVIEEIGKACCECGCFQIVNHGVPLEVMRRALKVSKKFFESPVEEKVKCSPLSAAAAPFPVGYNRKPNPLYEFAEYFVMLPPGSTYNVSLPNHQDFREVIEELFNEFLKVGTFLQTILGKCLGLPPNTLEEINKSRDSDVMSVLYYSPSTENEKIGLTPHKDVGCITILFQDEVGGLEVENNGVWTPVPPVKDALVVNLGIVLQVLTNEKFKSPSHRVMRPNGRSRNSFSFFFNVSGATVLEPLPEFTKEVGEKARYKRFVYKQFLQTRNEHRAKLALGQQQGGDDSGLSYFSLNS
ncbi:gibberellin 2-beta-dioxygenase 7-like [Ipomoea triloba]|uniref:gibberellin 2-beta-dioxygenase 7-like n=1 Tax=Ipomoea triloba TaxID=35885 RepID=UPI00125E99EF|nr:gibberellin 2-beta-dioxygenase 7-like [Ipomoea triloba]